MTIMQGDSYPIEIEIIMNGESVTPDMVDEIEVCVGPNIRRTYTAGEVVYSGGLWYFRLMQEDTINYGERTINVIVRVKLPNQPPDVVGRWAGKIFIKGTHSKEVL